jgi:hypothetical protein
MRRRLGRPNVERRRADALVAGEVGGARQIAGFGELREARVAEVVDGEGLRLAGRENASGGFAEHVAVVVNAEEQQREGGRTLGRDISRCAKLLPGSQVSGLICSRVVLRVRAVPGPKRANKSLPRRMVAQDVRANALRVLLEIFSEPGHRDEKIPIQLDPIDVEPPLLVDCSVGAARRTVVDPPADDPLTVISFDAGGGRRMQRLVTQHHEPIGLVSLLLLEGPSGEIVEARVRPSHESL